MYAASAALHASQCESAGGPGYRWTPGSSPLSSAEERAEVDAAAAHGNPTLVNQAFFVLSWPWFAAWREWACGGATRPPPINNGDLLEQGGSEGEGAVLRRGLVEKYDYVLVAAGVWQRLVAWYGGGPAIMRRVVRDRTTPVIDLYPITLKYSWEGRDYRITLAGANIFRIARHWIATAVNTPPTKLAMGLVSMDAEGKRRVTPVTGDALLRTLEESVSGSVAELEVSSIQSDTSSGYLPYATGYGSSYVPYRPPENERGKVVARGVVGLHNLGNTCFLNSTLQCLSAVPPLVNLFITDQHIKGRTNEKGNPMSTKGELAVAMQKLIAEIWSGQFRAVAPNDFKKVLSTWAPQFRGYQQHDAQEALLSITNLLHEDLVDVKSKAGGATPSSDNGRSVTLGASPIASLFGGVYQSVITCDDCGQENKIFEPFLNFPLPVPEKEQRKLPVMFFPLAGAPAMLGVRVNKAGNTRHIFHQVAATLEQPGLEGRLAAVQLSGNANVYEMGESKMVGSFRERDIMVAFETESGPEWRTCFVFSFRQVQGGGGLKHNDHGGHHGKKRGGGGGGSGGGGGGGGEGNASLCGIPIAVSVLRTDSGAEVMTRVKARISAIIGQDGGGFEGLVAVRATKFGGQLEASSELALKQQLDPSQHIALVWDREMAEFISKAHVGIPEHPSCQPGPLDKELTVPLSACFNLAGAPEAFTIADQWKCPRCQVAKPAVKVMSMWRAPPVLCLHLKRFKMDFVTREKLNTLVSFPEVLNVAEFVAGDELPKSDYQLVGVCNHVGGLSGGHYTAYCKVGGVWYDLDDRSAAPVSESSIVSPSAYVLYYVQKGLLDLNLPPLDATHEGEETAPAASSSSSVASKDAPSTPSSTTPHHSAVGAFPSPMDDPVTKKVKSVESSSNTTRHDTNVPVMHPNTDLGAEEEMNLSESQYLCDVCSMGVKGGWIGLSRHAKEAHGLDY